MFLNYSVAFEGYLQHSSIQGLFVHKHLLHKDMYVNESSQLMYNIQQTKNLIKNNHQKYNYKRLLFTPLWNDELKREEGNLLHFDVLDFDWREIKKAKRAKRAPSGFESFYQKSKKWQ